MTNNPKPERHLLCLGFGYTAGYFAQRLKATHKQFDSISGTTRNREKADHISTLGVTPILMNGDTDQLHKALSKTTHLLISIAPPRDGGDQGKNHQCPALHLIEKAGHLSLLKWIGYLSSNGVYGNHDGAFVDETTKPNPSGPRGKARYRAELAWLAFAKTHHIPTTIFRLPGIYGPARSALDNLRAGTAKRINKPGQVFSRMHVEDIAAALELAIDKPIDGSVLNLCDDEPSSPQDVITYAASLLGMEPPPLIDIEKAGLSPMGLSFYRDNKRVSNAKMKSTLGIKLAYPSYREGLQKIFADELSKGSR